MGLGMTCGRGRDEPCGFVSCHGEKLLQFLHIRLSVLMAKASKVASTMQYNNAKE